MKEALVINLSPLLHYSLEETIEAFVDLAYSKDSVLPDFFQRVWNKATISALMYKHNELLNSYKKGGISTEDFLDRLSMIFSFLKGRSREDQHSILRQAFTSSIRLTEETLGRLPDLVYLWSKRGDPIYLISNSNPMDIQAIVALFRTTYGHLINFYDVDLTVASTNKPLEIAEGLYLCTSYQFNAYKAGGDGGTTMSLLGKLVAGGIDEEGQLKPTGIIPLQPPHCTLVSQHEPDLAEGRRLGMAVQSAAVYFEQIRELKERGHFNLSEAVLPDDSSFACSSSGVTQQVSMR